MPLYQVLSRPDPAALYAGESGAVFIEEKFSWGAFVLMPVWALAHGLWRELVLWMIATALLVLLAFVIGFDAAFWLYVLGAVLTGFEAGNIRAASLRRDGYSPMGDIVAMAPEMAEMEYIKRGRTA